MKNFSAYFKVSAIATLLALSSGAFSQSITFDNVPPLTGGGNTAGGNVFNFATSIPITLEFVRGSFSTTTGTVTVWYNPTPVNGQPTINAANGWVNLGSAQMTGLSPGTNNPTPQTVPVPLNLDLNAGDTIGIAIQWTGNVFPTTNTSIPTFTNGFVTIIADASCAFTMNSGMTSFFTPRQINGGVVYSPRSQSPNDAGVTSIVSPVNFCPNSLQDVSATIRNFGQNQITNVQVNWSVDGLIQSPVQFVGLLDTIGGSGSVDTTIVLGSFFFGTAATNLAVWTSLPNGVTDTITTNDSAFRTVQPALSGILTVGGTGADYSTLGAAASAINAGGLCANTELHITGNTVETNQVEILDNASGFTLTIKPVGGNFTISGSIAGGLLRLSGSENVIIDGLNGGQAGGLTFTNTTTTTNSAAIHISTGSQGTGCKNVHLKNLIIEGGSTTVTSAFGVSVSGPAITTTSTGSGHQNIRIENNVIRNSYYGVYARGTAVSPIDSLLVLNNVFGSQTNANTIAFRGLDIQGADAPLVSSNLFQNITIGTTVTISAMDIGANTSNAFIEKNTIRGVVQTNTSGGAYGISLSGGANSTVVNNVISGVRANNALNSSQLTNAFGIRISSGTGHKLYYNSVNMHGAYTNTATGGMASAALVVSSIAATGLDIRNNIFANTITAATTGPQNNVALWFIANYPFSSITLNHNAYFITPNSSSHNIGRLGTTSGTGLSADLASWRQVSQVGNPLNDINSQPINNATPPFIAADSLMIPVNTFTPAESGGVVIPDLGLPNVDFLGLARPAFSGNAPDIGAYEFDGIAGDFIAPSIDSVFFDPDSGLCIAAPRVVTAIVTDLSSIDTVQILYTVNGVNQPVINMLPSFLPNSYSATIPAAGSGVVNFRIRAVDGSPNANTALSFEFIYQDEYLSGGLVASTSTPAITQGDSVSLSVFSPLLEQLKFTEVVLFRTGTGATNPFPSFIPAGNDDFVEITNLSGSPADLSGFQFEIFGSGARQYTFPAGVILPGNQVLILQIGVGTDQPANNFYYTGGSNNPWGSGGALGIVLRTPTAITLDAVAFNSFTFPANSGVSINDWSGIGAPSPSGASGSQLLGADLNNSSNWTANSAGSLGTLGAVNSGLTFTNPLSVSWTYLGSPIGTSPSINFGPVNDLGVITFTVTISDGVCTASTTVDVNVGTGSGFDFEETLTSIDVFPNPATDRVRIKLNGDYESNTQLHLYDSRGLRIWTKEILDDQEFDFLTTSLPRGLYLLSLESAQSRFTKQVVFE